VKLQDLLSVSSEYRILAGNRETEISGLSYDSRLVRPGDLFFSLARNPEQNRRNLEQALSRGARAVVVRGWDDAQRPPAVLLVSPRPRFLMAAVAARFFGAPSERLDLIGVTGTSGKTTTTYLLESIFQAAGDPGGVIGTVGIRIGQQQRAGGLTTPESVDLESILAEMEQAHVKHVAAEISSIGIAEGRAEALNFRAALFTNLGRDHLDYHHTQEDYFAAKLRLFTELLPQSRRAGAVAVARGDEPWGMRVLNAVNGSKLSFGLSPSCDVHPRDYSVRLDGIRATVAVPGQIINIRSPLLGEINLLNILGAVAVCHALGIAGEAMEAGVRHCRGAPGRLEAITSLSGVTALVDYAHKPDALGAVLDTLRALNPQRILCVFGCGGDRDRGKRPIMGEIAGRLADLPILTSDNPRTEDPLAIIAEVEAGLSSRGLKRIDAEQASAASGYVVEPDRRKAIHLALTLARPGDTVLIAGKGHEDYQLIGSRKLKFDDREVVREIFEELEKN
jgi:UDP-N-acetylmuramoyl-L-alanyl-D-glutamate--2,6-diaminopimelate ligase